MSEPPSPMSGRHPRLGERRLPLACFLPVQALLLLVAPGHLPLWGDEYASLTRADLPETALLEALRHNVHPPLYAEVLQRWLALPWHASELVRARVLSALLVLSTTVVLDRTWLRQVDARTRTWFLLLWTFSPALLLYGRMARSYSLQLALATPALWLGWQVVQAPRLRTACACAGLVALLLYTHYLPGLAVLGAISLCIVGRWIGTRQPLLLGALLLLWTIVGLAYLPWISALGLALGRVEHGTPYSPLGGGWLDAAAGLAYALLSFSVGEALWPWIPALVSLLALGLALWLWRALRAPPAWLALLLPVAAIAWLGATRWVSYAFVAARLLFLLPFYLLLLLHGVRDAPRLRTAVGGLWLALSIAGLAAYFAGVGFLNQAYVIPAEAIAHAIAPPDRATIPSVVLDHRSINLTPLQLYLPPAAEVRLVQVTQVLPE